MQAIGQKAYAWGVRRPVNATVKYLKGNMSAAAETAEAIANSRGAGDVLGELAPEMAQMAGTDAVGNVAFAGAAEAYACNENGEC